jgi:hypothetical protein
MTTTTRLSSLELRRHTTMSTRPLTAVRAPLAWGLFRYAGCVAAATAAMHQTRAPAAARRALLHTAPSRTAALRMRAPAPRPAWAYQQQQQQAPRRGFQSSVPRWSEQHHHKKDDGGRHGREDGANKTKDNKTDEAKLGFGARLKKMSKEYGWAALGVYLGLSVLDFPFCFLLVRAVGTEKIGKPGRRTPEGGEVRRKMRPR